MSGSASITTRTLGTGDVRIENAQLNLFRDEFWEATGDYILKRGNYCATHPLAKNSFWFWSSKKDFEQHDHVVWMLSAYLYLPWKHHHHQYIMNKFTLFQTSTMTDEELDLYWAEIAQVRNWRKCWLTLDFRFSNCPLSLVALPIHQEKNVSPSSQSPV